MVGFVNESLLYVQDETDARIAVLKMWTDAGVELGNHTFSHLGFKDATLQEFEDEFVRGEAVTKKLLQPNGIRYFRHPFPANGKHPRTGNFVRKIHRRTQLQNRADHDRHDGLDVFERLRQRFKGKR